MLVIIFFAFVGCLVASFDYINNYYKPKLHRAIIKGLCGLILGAVIGLVIQALVWAICLGIPSTQEVSSVKEYTPIAIDDNYLTYSDHNGKFMFYIEKPDVTITTNYSNRSDTTIIPVTTKEEVKIVVTEYKFKPWVFSWLTIFPCVEYDTMAYITPQIIPEG